MAKVHLLILFSVTAATAALLAGRPAQGIDTIQDVGHDIQIDRSSIGGVVRARASGKGEAGVWVIAETSSLPSRFRRIVVTDEEGRFVVPALPEGRYELWGRGYGLQDSKRVPAERGGLRLSTSMPHRVPSRPPESIRRVTGWRCSSLLRGASSRSDSRADPTG
jgi:hypothetical protein